MSYKPVRELYLAYRTKKYAPDLTLWEYWLWRMYRRFQAKHPLYK